MIRFSSSVKDYELKLLEEVAAQLINHPLSTKGFFLLPFFYHMTKALISEIIYVQMISLQHDLLRKPEEEKEKV